MSNHSARYLLAALLAIAPAAAKTINATNVTNDSQVLLGTDDDLVFTLAADSASTYPGAIQILLGSMPLGGPVESIPGTSGVYMPGLLFTGTLESQNGGISIPLTDPNAARVGLPAGDLLLTPGSRSGGSYSGPIDLISAEVMVSSQQAAELFAAGDFMIDLHDVAAPVTFGYAGTPIVSDFTASLISADGAQSDGARVMQADCVHPSNAPEPGTIGLLIIGLTILARRAWGRGARL
jgi:hypothetical protein